MCFDVQVWFDIYTFKKHSGGQNLYIPVTISSVSHVIYHLQKLHAIYNCSYFSSFCIDVKASVVFSGSCVPAWGLSYSQET